MKSTQLESQPVNEVLSRQESAHIPAPSQAVPDLKEIPHDQGTSLDEPLDGLVLAVLLRRARTFMWHVTCQSDEEEQERGDLIDEIDQTLGIEAPDPSATVTNGAHDDWADDSELPF